MSVHEAALALAAQVDVDEDADVVRWPGGQVGLHDYAGLYAVQGLYEAVYFHVLGGGSPALLAAALADVVPAAGRPGCRVLDVGAGTGMVGEELARHGFRDVAGVDLEPASALALRRDRPGVYAWARAVDLLQRTPGDDRWLAEVAPDVVTVAGAVGFGHLPVEAFAELTALLPAGGLLAVTLAPELVDDPSLSALLLGPAYEVVLRRDGRHRRSGAADLPVAALVLRRVR